jgi:cysteine desulfurase
MHTNNEIGAVQPIDEAGAIIKRMNPNTLFHVDAVQGFGKYRIYPKRMNIDLLSVSAHKIHGPKGVGFLYINEKAKVRPIIYGGGQQKGMRSGTENVPGIAGMAKAVEEIYEDFEAKTEYLYAIKEKFVKGVTQIEGIKLNGPFMGSEGAPHVVSVSIQGIKSEVMLHALEDKGIYVSAGSACASNKPTISATLKAIGVEKQYLDSTLRFSFSLFTTAEEIDYTVNCMKEIIPMLRRYTRR